MIAIIDYDMGNVGAIKNMYHHIGIDDVIITRNKEEILIADHLILPGVGAFDAGMINLKEYGLLNLIRTMALEKKKPILGICLGMQLLGRRSEEGKEEGLNLIEFNTVRFDTCKMQGAFNSTLKIPHMGWDCVTINNYDNCITANLIGENQRYYFVHSFHAVCENKKDILMSCDYGYRFDAAVMRDNIVGVQFHPEKSHRFGMKLLKNFAMM